MRMLICAAWMAALLVPGTASAACTAAITSVGQVPVVQYDPFAGGAAADELELELLLEGEREGCELGLTVFGLSPGAGRQAALGPDRLIYRLFVDGREIADDPAVSVPLPLPEQERGRVRVRIEVPAGQIGPAGTYSDPVTLRLVDRSAADAPLGSDMAAVVTVAMASRAQINLAGGSVTPGGFGFARMDFGRLEQGAVRRARIQVRSTAPVSLTVSSEQGGKLVRVGGSESVGYELRLDNEALALEAGSSGIARGAAPTLAGAGYWLDVAITGNPETVPAGEYRDLLTIDVTPQ